MRFAIIQDGVVQNIANASEEFGQQHGWIPSAGAKIGDLWDGDNFTSPPPSAPVVPQQVTMAQARNALEDAGISSADVDAAIENIQNPAQKRKAKNDWEYAPYVRRNSNLTKSLGAMLGLTEQQIDELFIAAEKL